MLLPAWVMTKIRELPSDYTGSFTVNCFKGGVSNMNKNETLKEQTSEPNHEGPRVTSTR